MKDQIDNAIVRTSLKCGTEMLKMLDGNARVIFILFPRRYIHIILICRSAQKYVEVLQLVSASSHIFNQLFV